MNISDQERNLSIFSEIHIIETCCTSLYKSLGKNAYNSNTVNHVFMYMSTSSHTFRTYSKPLQKIPIAFKGI